MKPETAIAIWALTPNGVELAETIQAAWPGASVFVSAKLQAPSRGIPFFRLADAVKRQFHEYAGHVFIMSTGIVVRTIAGLLAHKTRDPAVVVADERGDHAISLVSGHIGGANQLAVEIAQIIGAKPVITTATDLNHLPAIDRIAAQRGLFIQNPSAIKGVSMALLQGKKIGVFDPMAWIQDAVFSRHGIELKSMAQAQQSQGPGVFVHHAIADLAPDILVLRPPSLTAGIGCNRNTPLAEIQALLEETVERFHLSIHSLARLATIDAKSDEPGILALAERLGVGLRFYTREQLSQVLAVENPSEIVNQHMGVKSVCEAAALLAARSDKLIVGKQKTRNVTVAVAQRHFA